MADVAIIHAADKGTAASRLAEAIAAAGFSAGAVEVEDPAGLADAVEGSDADARILIWSRALVSHALHSGELHRIRQLRGLIEVSADGITPPSRGDDARVVSISGWRGQPFHPGWQRIHAELKRLCGTRKAPAEPPPTPARANSPEPQRTAAAAAPGGVARPQARRIALGGGIAVLLVAAAAGAAGWLGGGAPEPPSRQQPGEPSAPAAVREAPRPGPAAAPQAPEASVTAPPVANLVPPPQPAAPAAEAAPEASKARPAAQAAAKSRPAARPRPRPSAQAEPVKKYSRKNSKVMREFCEKSGRSTPQCRTFLRSTRGGGASD